MIHRDELISRIHTYFGQEWLATARARDEHLANGIQILGKEEINTIVVGVSATVELFEAAKKRHADVVLAKHPMKITAPFQLLDRSFQERLRMVFTNNWTVGGYHYLMDVHPEVGNVPILMEKLGIARGSAFFNGWGYIGEFDKPQPLARIAEFLEKIVNHPVFQVIPSEKKTAKRVGIVTGGGIPRQEELLEMLEHNLDLYITGEISEWTTHLYREAGIAYFAAGHHATEVFGPQAFADVLQKLVGEKAKVEFVNIWSDI